MILSELFYSIQGEGKYTGVPSIFLRSSQCNLRCNGTWKCDTWNLLGKGNEYSTTQIVNWMISSGIMGRIKDYSTHIVLTGGEPFIEQQALDFVSLLKNIENCFVEVETNGTQMQEDLFQYVDHITCSPKMSGNGMPYDSRIKKEVLMKIITHPSYCFKFVISNDGDFKECQHLIKELGIKKQFIYLMPAGATREEMISNLPMVWGFAEKYGYRVSTRLHVTAFDSKTGV